MDITEAISFEIKESSQVGEARREILKFAHNLGFNVANEARLGLVCAELSTNLLKHTPHGGQLIIQGLSDGHRVGIELYSMDSGNGMNVADCLEDGFSSSGTMGTGLGAVKRNTDNFNIYAQFQKGSVVETRIWNESEKHHPETNFGVLNIPKPGELVSGDKVCFIETDEHVICLLVDGLGHGIEASDASNLAVRRFKENIDKPPAVALKAIHTSLRGSRGAVGAVARIDKKNMRVFFCGMGNIAAIVTSSFERKHLTSLNGTLGYEARRFMEFTVPWTKESLLVMHSDGLSSKTFEDLTSIEKQPACIIAGWLFQHYSRGNDDSTILVYKQSQHKTN
ncbi:MAG TPA: SpoIIE family protein phosphatase [Drouetiella sp.]